MERSPLWLKLFLPPASVLIFFVILESALTLIGVTPILESKDPFVGFAAGVPLFVPDSGQRMVTASNKLDFFNSQSFQKEKSPGTYRIFSLGGSTTYGRPYDDATSFSGWLREFLPAADGAQKWEVINAGGISYASYRVAHLMKELVQYKPDLFIVYTGHNEFLEERTYRKMRKVSGAAVLARTRTWTAMRSVFKRMGVLHQSEDKSREQLAGKVTTILARSAGPERYARDDTLRDNILHHYRSSLERMVALSRNSGSKIVFVVPASNLKDCSPFKSEHTTGLDLTHQRRSSDLLKGAENAIHEEDWSAALNFLDEGLSADPRHAGLHYHRGKVLLALKRSGEAAIAFRQARDEDVCPLRALTPIRRIVSEVALEKKVPLVDFVDESAMPGQELFLDHVHPTIEGNKLLALSLVEVMIDQGWVHTGESWGEAAIAVVSKKIEDTINPENHALALANLARVLNWAGKSEDAMRLATQALSAAPKDPKVKAKASSVLATIFERRNQPERAIGALFSAIVAAPENPELRLKLGLMQLDPPILQINKAAGNLLLATHLMPQTDLAHLTFGIAMAKRGRLQVAYPSVVEALRLNPKNTEAKHHLRKLRSLLGERIPDKKGQMPPLESYPTGAPRKLVQLDDGIVVEWHENGRLKRLQDIENGMPKGLVYSWDKAGNQI